MERRSVLFVPEGILSMISDDTFLRTSATATADIVNTLLFDV